MGPLQILSNQWPDHKDKLLETLTPKIIVKYENEEGITETDIRKIAKELGSSVVIPADRNPGCLIIQCPLVHHCSILTNFIEDTKHYEIIPLSETQILEKMGSRL